MSSGNGSDAQGNDGGKVRKSIFGSIRSKFSSKKSSEALNQDALPADAPPTYNDAISSAGGAAGTLLSPNTAAAAPARSRSPSPAPRSGGRLSPYPSQNASSSAPGTPNLASESITSLADPWAFLARFDTIFLIDDSGSMTGRSWREVKSVLSQIVPICAMHDNDGIEINFLNYPHKWEHIKDDTALDEVFRKVFPTSMTPTGERLKDILDPYVADFENKVRREGCAVDKTGMKPVNLIVVTDGRPTDPADLAVEKVLINVAQRLDKVGAPLTQVGVQFFQVGDDWEAKMALQKLDDDLGGRVRGGKLRDIVDTVTFDQNDGHLNVLTYEAILKVVLGAVQRKFDKQVLVDKRQQGGFMASFRN